MTLQSSMNLSVLNNEPWVPVPRREYRGNMIFDPETGMPLRYIAPTNQERDEDDKSDKSSYNAFSDTESVVRPTRSVQRFWRVVGAILTVALIAWLVISIIKAKQ